MNHRTQDAIVNGLTLGVGMMILGTTAIAAGATLLGTAPVWIPYVHLREKRIKKNEHKERRYQPVFF